MTKILIERFVVERALEAFNLTQTDIHWELNSPTRKFLRKAEKNLRAALERASINEAELVCAEAYQVVGCLLHDTGRFDSPEGQKILDNLRRMRRMHSDVLPWPSAGKAEQANGQARGQEAVAIKCRLVQIHDALSNDLGDTDPYVPEDMTDEEIAEEMPVFWAAKEIAALIGDAPWNDYTTPPAQPAREWVSLTDEERIMCTQSTFNADNYRANKAKLRQKNSGKVK